MTASAPSNTAVATSETSARVGTGSWTIGFEHLGGHDHRPPGAARGAGDLFLTAWNLFKRQLDTEIAPRDHDAVGKLENLRQHGEGRRLFDLGHDAGPSAHELARLGYVVRALHERQGDPVDAVARGNLEVGPILGRQGGHGENRIRQIDALAGRKSAAEYHPRLDPARGYGGDLDPNAPVVEQQVVANPGRLEDLTVRQMNPLLIARTGVVVEGEELAGGHLHLILPKGADAQFRALEVGENADRPAALGLDGADGLAELDQTFVRGVAHVDAEHIRAGKEEAFNLLGSGGSGP